MKKVRELTTTHYRRSVRRSTSGRKPQNVEVPLHCPICGARLTADLIKNSEGTEDTRTAHGSSPRLLRI